MSAQQNFSRASFSEAAAPHNQLCSCECGGRIKAGQLVFQRPHSGGINKGQMARLIDLDEHYDQWTEKLARKYAEKVAERDDQFRTYLG